MPKTGGFFQSVWNQVQDFFVAMFEAVWSGFVRMIRPAVRQIEEEASEVWGAMTDENWGIITKYLSHVFAVDEKEINALFGTEKPPWPLSMIYDVMVLVMTVGTSMMQTAGVLNEDNVLRLLSQTTPRVPYPSLLMNAAFVAPEKTQEVRDAMKQSGYKDEYIDLLFLAMYRVYDEGVCRDLFLRGELTEDEMYKRMAELGYTDKRIGEMSKLWESIPPIPDIITMAFRGSFTPENREKWPWAFDAPGDFVEWAGKQGITKEWSERYWYMHWTQPGVREMFEMMHRGAITEVDLDHTLKVVGYSDYWIEKLKTITYLPYTRVDVRRMHDLGVIDTDELIQSYMDLGYDFKKATSMAEFTIKYNMGTEKTLTKAQVIKAYMDHILPKKNALSELTAMGYSKDRAEFLIASEEYYELQEYNDMAIDNVRDRYQNNLITREQAQDRLSKLNIDGRRIEILLEKWTLNIFEDRKIPSKTDLDKFVRNKVIDLKQYRKEMNKLGYNETYIDWYEKLLSVKKP